MSLKDLLVELKEVLPWGFGILFVLSGLVEVSKIKVNPWSAIMKWLGRRINADVLQKLDTVEIELASTKDRLEEHIKMDDRRTADGHRTRILHFNNELLRNIPHTKEEFIEILHEIDAYEKYCRDNPGYPNNRAVMAIENIREVYRARFKNHDFLDENGAGREGKA